MSDHPLSIAAGEVRETQQSIERLVMPWLVIYIGLLFPIMLLLVVLAMDWQQRQHERQEASGLQASRTAAQDGAHVECPQSAHRRAPWWKAF